MNNDQDSDDSPDANPARLNLDFLISPEDPHAFGLETLAQKTPDIDDPGPHFTMRPLRPETLLRRIR